MFLKNPHVQLFVSFILSILIWSGMAIGSSGNSQPWTTCFNKSKNKLYFRSNTENVESKKCSSAISFKVPKEFHLIETVKDGVPHFSTPIAGTKRTLRLNNSRRLLVSQWNNLSKANKILVLEPNMRSHKVVKHCVLDNFSDAYSARYNAKTKKVEVLVNLPKTLGGNDYRRVWKTCKI